MNDQPVQNTDRELWREHPDDYYADSIHVTEGGGIGINCGGLVFVKPIREWHALAKAQAGVGPASPVRDPAPPRYEKDLAHLATLGPNWDSYGGVPITPEALAAVRAFIAQLQIVPRSNGGLQIEIHKERHDVEVSFEPDGKIEDVFAENPEAAVGGVRDPSPPEPEIQETLDILLPLRQRIARMRSPHDQLGSITEMEGRAIERLALFVITRGVRGAGVVPSAPSLPAIQELLDVLEPLLDNAEGYDKSNVRAAFLALPESPRRGKLLGFEERARIAWKVARGLSSAAAPPVTDEQIHAALIESPRATTIRLTDAEAVPLVRAAMAKLGGVDSGGVAPAGEPSAEQNDAIRPAYPGNAVGEALPKP